MRLWIKSYQATDRDPQTRKFCRLTGLDTPAAVGTLHILWWWALDWAEDGDISKFDAADIADAVHFEGKPEVLFSALVDSGYVAKTMEGYEIVEWYEIGGQIIEGRKKAAKKKADQRAKTAAKKAAEKAGSADVPGDIPGTSSTGPPNVPVQRELDKEIDLDIEKDLKSEGDADQKQDQEPKAEQPAGEAAVSGNPPKTPEKGGRKRPVYEKGNAYLNMAEYLKSKIDELSAIKGLDLAPKANLQNWADELRLMEEVQKYTNRSLTRELMDWCMIDDFWTGNILSAAKFRKQYARLVIDMEKAKKKAATGNKGSGGSGGRGGYSGKVEIPIYQDDGQSGAVSAEEHAALMKKAAEIKASKQGAVGR